MSGVQAMPVLFWNSVACHSIASASPSSSRIEGLNSVAILWMVLIAPVINCSNPAIFPVRAR